MSLFSAPTLRDYTFGCVSCDEQIVIEKAVCRDYAERVAIVGGWTRAASNALECPQCSQTSIERLVKGTR